MVISREEHHTLLRIDSVNSKARERPGSAFSNANPLSPWFLKSFIAAASNALQCSSRSNTTCSFVPNAILHCGYGRGFQENGVVVPQGF